MTRKLRLWFFPLFLLLFCFSSVIGAVGSARADTALPDLIVTSISWTPAQPYTGDSVVFSAVVENQGAAATPANVIIGGVFSVDGNVVVYTDNDSTSLPAGASVTLTANGGGSNGNGTWVAQTGTHTISFLVDDVNRIAESNENNNSYTDPNALVINPKPGPDLVINNVTWQPNALQVGNQVTFSAVLANQGIDPAPSGAVVQFDVDGQDIASGTASSGLAPGQSATVTATQSWTVTNGAHNVEAIADPANVIAESHEDNNTLTITLSVGQQVSDTAKSSDAFVDSIGVNTHLSYYDTPYGNYTTLVKPLLQQAGIRYIRDGAYAAQSDVINKINDLGAAGIKTDLLASETDPNTEMQVVTQTASSLASFEGPNEPDIGGPFKSGFPSSVQTYQNTMYNLIKANASTASLPVVSPSPVNKGSAQALGALSCDIGNAHPYAGGLLPDRSMSAGIASANVMCPNKPVWFTEVGYDTAVNNTSGQPGVSPTAQAKYVARTYLDAFSQGVQRSFLYEFIDEFSDANLQNPEADFGIVNNDGTPKPAFTAVENLISLLKDPGANFTPQGLSYTLNGNTSNLQHVLLQKQDGSYYLVLWLNDYSYDLSSKQDIAVPPQSVSVSFNQTFAQAATYQPVESTSSTATFSNTGTFTLSVPDEPVVLQLQGGSGTPAGRYKLVNHNSGQVLDDTALGGSGTTQEQWSDNGGANQHWDLKAVNNGYYQVTNALNGLALDVSGGSTTEGAKLLIDQYTGADSQLWSISSAGGGYYELINKHSGYVMDVSQASKNQGAAVIQWPDHSGANQQWQLVSVS